MKNSGQSVTEWKGETYFSWNLPGEVAIRGEFETTGVLRGDVYNVNVPRLSAVSDMSTAGVTDIIYQLQLCVISCNFYNLSI